MENQNQSPKTQLIERLKQANNVLVTVSRNPSVDQLSAAIGLTLMLNHLDKHATAVFSGEIPNTLEFLKPDETLEKTTDSLRDFIISLDKAKADKLRYKVEDKMVKIFITPYRTSLTEADLVFGQGDFNVDVVVAIGVQEKEDLDEAITSHGRILHDATVATVNTAMSGQLGSINWVDAKASSLSEMLVPVCEGLKVGALDAQMATAFLTGIVAETARFSNEKTSSDTMNISAKLMSAGANQQLVATQLEQPQTEKAPEQNNEAGSEINIAENAVADALDNDGSLEIAHADSESNTSENDEPQDLPEVQPENHDESQENSDDESSDDETLDKPSRLILEPPTLGSKLTANTEPEALDPSTDPLTLLSTDAPILTHDKDEQEPDITPQEALPASIPEPEVPKPEPTEEISLPPVEDVLAPPEVETSESPGLDVSPEADVPDDQTLSDLESAVDSKHVVDSLLQEHQQTPDAEAALAAAHQAFEAVSGDKPEKPADFNASSPMDVPHNESTETSEADEVQPSTSDIVDEPTVVSIDPSTGMLSYPTNLVSPSTDLPADPTAAGVSEATSAPAPPVPPPMPMPPLMPPHESLTDPNNLPPVPQ